jgi:hypothetical protein
LAGFEGDRRCEVIRRFLMHVLPSRAVRTAGQAAGIAKRVSPHTL